ncbi:MAG: AgmX/PglI C-terminal domain-containing protein [Oligoflexales bacterium]
MALGKLALLLCAWGFCSDLLAGYVKAAQVKRWGGEFLPPNTGAFALLLDTEGFPLVSKTGEFSSDANLFLREKRTKALYVYNQKVPQSNPGQRFVFLLPAGDYVVDRIELVDHQGKLRKWSPRKSKVIYVRALTLAQLGVWQIAPYKSDLKVKFKMDQKHIRPKDLVEGDKTFMAFIDGFTGKVVGKYGGKAVYEASLDEFGEEDELRSSYTVQTRIAVVFKLTLRGGSKPEYADVSTILSVNDTNIRGCYTSGLEVNEKIKGTVKFNFVLSKATGTMKNVKHSGGTLQTQKVISCLYYELGAIKFPINRDISGNVQYLFQSETV